MRWRAMRCNTGHGVVGASWSQAQHVRGMLWESWKTFGRSGAVVWCFGMRHFAPWWMTVVCVGLASFGASSRVSGGTRPVTVRSWWVRRAVSLGWDGGAAF